MNQELEYTRNSVNWISDAKNPRSSENPNNCSFSLSQKTTYANTTYDSHSHQTSPDYQSTQLRQALCEAIEENELLRQRVVELEALLGEAQLSYECLEEKYVNDMNYIQKSMKESGHGFSADKRSKSL